MQQLIKINTDDNGNKNVSARELYDVLGYDKSQWKRWYVKNITNNQFAIENVDWAVFDIMSNTDGGRPTVDFVITLDFAKKLSMLARTKKGDEVRDYFLECERQSQKPKQDLLSLSKLEILQMAIESETERIKLAEEKKQLQAENAKLAPKAEVVDIILTAKNCYTVTDIAKELGMGAPTLNKKLCEMGIQRKFQKHYVLYAKYQNKGYTETRTEVVQPKGKDPFTVLQMVWTQRGRMFIHSKMNPKLSFYSPPQIKVATA